MAQIDQQFQFSNYWPQLKDLLVEVRSEMIAACIAQPCGDNHKVMAMHAKAQAAREICEFIVARVEVGIHADHGPDEDAKITKENAREWVEKLVRGV